MMMEDGNTISHFLECLTKLESECSEKELFSTLLSLRKLNRTINGRIMERKETISHIKKQLDDAEFRKQNLLYQKGHLGGLLEDAKHHESIYKEHGNFDQDDHATIVAKLESELGERKKYQINLKTLKDQLSLAKQRLSLKRKEMEKQSDQIHAITSAAQPLINTNTRILANLIQGDSIASDGSKREDGNEALLRVFRIFEDWASSKENIRVSFIKPKNDEMEMESTEDGQEEEREHEQESYILELDDDEESENGETLESGEATLDISDISLSTPHISISIIGYQGALCIYQEENQSSNAPLYIKTDLDLSKLALKDASLGLMDEAGSYMWLQSVAGIPSEGDITFNDHFSCVSKFMAAIIELALGDESFMMDEDAQK